MTLKDLPADVVERQIAKDGRARVQVFPRKKLIDIDDLRAFVHVMLQYEPDATGTSVTVNPYINASAGKNLCIPSKRRIRSSTGRRKTLRGHPVSWTPS